MTSEELATILREELPDWEVVAHPPSYDPTTPYATAKRGDWEVRVSGPCRYPEALAIVEPPQPDCGCDYPDQMSEWVPMGDAPLEDVREGVRKVVAKARAWVAALQAGCP